MAAEAVTMSSMGTEAGVTVAEVEDIASKMEEMGEEMGPTGSHLSTTNPKTYRNISAAIRSTTIEGRFV